MTQEHLRRKVLSFTSKCNDGMEKKAKIGESSVLDSEMVHRHTQSANKNPIHPGKDGRERLASNYKSHHRTPIESEASYFPDHVARVSYIASVVNPEADGNYLGDLQDGMKSLATRLAPSHFPGTIVSQITTQVDGYFPSPCPSSEFTNCQDVSASIGIYLSAAPVIEEKDVGGVSEGARVDGSSKSTEANTLVDPSTMTEELLAFQESFKAAIDNDELQIAIEAEYRRKQDDDIIPPIVIVTDSVNNVGVGMKTDSDSDSTENASAIDINYIFDEMTDPSNDTVGISSSKPTSARVAEAKKADDLRTVGIVTSGILGAAFMSVLLISFLGVGRRRRRSGNDTAIVEVKEKIRRHHKNRHSKLKDRYDCDHDGDKGEQQLLTNGTYVADRANRSGDEEEGFAGRTLRTVDSDSSQTTSSNDTLIQLIASTSDGYSLDNDENAETRTSKSNEKLTIVTDLSSSDVVSSDEVSSLKNENVKQNNEIGTEEVNDKNEDDDEDAENDFVLGEDDESESSVVQNLLSVSRSSDSPIPSESQTTSDDPLHDEKEATISETLFPVGPTNSDTGKSPQIPTLDPPDIENPFSVLDAAIANEEWATVGAEAAIFASEPRPPIRHTKSKDSSSSTPPTLPDFPSKADELNSLIEAGDWEAVVIKVSKYDAGGETPGGGMSEDEANRSYQSKTSTQGSDTNESFVSLIDNASESRSLDKSVTTSGSQKERLEEVRTKVIRLVRDVAPDEEQNVDEMMIQFKEREQDLLESLISMKERLVARKSRIESQKLARRNTMYRDESEDPKSSDLATRSLNLMKKESGEDSTIDEVNTNDDNCTSGEGGYFENVTKADQNKAAADAAAWAIQRSLDKMIEEEDKL